MVTTALFLFHFFDPEGNFKDPKTNTLDAVWEVLRNAFIQALVPSVDHEININSVGTEEAEDKKNLLQRIFKPDKKKDDQKKKQATMFIN